MKRFDFQFNKKTNYFRICTLCIDVFNRRMTKGAPRALPFLWIVKVGAWHIHLEQILWMKPVSRNYFLNFAEKRMGIPVSFVFECLKRRFRNSTVRISKLLYAPWGNALKTKLVIFCYLFDYQFQFLVQGMSASSSRPAQDVELCHLPQETFKHFWNCSLKQPV